MATRTHISAAARNHISAAPCTPISAAARTSCRHGPELASIPFDASVDVSGACSGRRVLGDEHPATSRNAASSPIASSRIPRPIPRRIPDSLHARHREVIRATVMTLLDALVD